MNNADFIEQARTELNNRIMRTRSISEQFLNSYSVYSSKARQAFLLVLHGIIIFAVIWAMINFGGMPVYLASLSVMLYMGLLIYRSLMYISRINKIDTFANEVRKIEEYLRSKLNDLSNIASNVTRDILGQANKKLGSDYDVDADIEKYSGILEAYQNPEDNALSTALTAMHWLSGILFTGAFLLVSTPLIDEKFSYVSLFYACGIIMVYIILQELFSKISMLRVNNKIKEIMGYSSIVGMSAALLYLILGSGEINLFGNSMQSINIDGVERIFSNYFTNAIKNQYHFDYWEFTCSMSLAYMPLVICSIFSLIICTICKIDKTIKYVIGTFFAIGIYIILLYLIFGLNLIFFLETVHKPLELGFIKAILISFVPLMTSVFFSSIISIMYRMATNFSVVGGSVGAIYLGIYFIMGIYESGIKYYLIGDVIIWAISLFVLAIGTIIALVPSGIIVGIVTSVEKDEEQATSPGYVYIVIIITSLITAFVISSSPENKEVKKAQVKESKQVQTSIVSAQLTDSRNNKTYKTVQIGNQTWMAENLNYKIGKSSCYENSDAKCNECGRLYDWTTAMKACPNGWRLPTSAEWVALGNAVGGSSTAGMSLKSKNGWSNNGNGTDKPGFSALPCGRHYEGKFLYHGRLANFWTATQTDDNYAWGSGLDANNANLDIGNLNKLYLRSVRCVRN